MTGERKPLNLPLERGAKYYKLVASLLRMTKTKKPTRMSRLFMIILLLTFI